MERMSYRINFEIDKEVLNIIPIITINLNRNSKGIVLGWICFYCIITKK